MDFPKKMGEIFESLPENQVASALRLSTQSGWNQTAADWDRLRRLRSGAIGVWIDDGEVRASFSLVGHGHIAWIGMILVDTAYRGAGLGKAAFRAAIEHARLLGFETLGLDATDLGEPIYLKAGFQTIGSIARWEGTLESSRLPDTTQNMHLGLTPQILELDAKETQANRSELLADLARDNAVVSCGRDGSTLAYAILRAGRQASHLGPVVAQTKQDFGAILDAVAWQSSGQKVLCDVLSREIEDALTARGFQPRRHLKRMTLPLARGCLCPPAARCAAGLELG